MKIQLYKNCIEFTFQAYYDLEVEKVKKKIDYLTDRVRFNGEIQGNPKQVIPPHSLQD